MVPLNMRFIQWKAQGGHRWKDWFLLSLLCNQDNEAGVITVKEQWVQAK
jgi:hypothetical protein